MGGQVNFFSSTRETLLRIVEYIKMRIIDLMENFLLTQKRNIQCSIINHKILVGSLN